MGWLFVLLHLGLFLCYLLGVVVVENGLFWGIFGGGWWVVWGGVHMRFAASDGDL